MPHLTDTLKKPVWMRSQGRVYSELGSNSCLFKASFEVFLLLSLSPSFCDLFVGEIAYVSSLDLTDCNFPSTNAVTWHALYLVVLDDIIPHAGVLCVSTPQNVFCVNLQLQNHVGREPLGMLGDYLGYLNWPGVTHLNSGEDHSLCRDPGLYEWKMDFSRVCYHSKR